MKEAAQVTALVVDHGLFFPLAQHLGKSYKRVLYWKPNSVAFPTINQCCQGDGFEEVELTEDPWEYIDKGEIDLAVFPDILDSGLQLHLEDLGIPVWGSRRGDSIELIREKFLRILRDSGLPVPKYTRVVGITELRRLLRDKEDCYLKISRYRGSLETTHWRSWGEDEGLLDMLAVRFGLVREIVPFLVFDAIDTDIEDGADTFCIDGQWPDLMLRGVECKDRGYLGAVSTRASMPDHIVQVMEAFGPVLAPYRYRNFFSMEIRVQDDVGFFIDPTCRGPVPGTDSQSLIWKNTPEIIWAGAHGDLVQPQPRAWFTAECMLSVKGDKQSWSVIDMPDSLREWMKIGGCCQVGDKIGFPPDHSHDDSNEIGWLCAIGDTPRETIDALKAHAEELPDGVTADMDSLIELVQESDKMDEEGIPFTDEEMPEPAEVVEKS